MPAPLAWIRARCGKPAVAVCSLLAGVGLAVGCDGDGGGPLKLKTIELESSPGHLSYGSGRVWVSTGQGELVRVDPARVKTETVAGALPGGPVVEAGGSVWVADESEGTLTRVDPRTGRRSQFKLVDVFATDDRIDALVAAAGALWVAAGNGVIPVDPRTGRRLGPAIVIGGTTTRLVVAGESLWALIGSGYDPRPPSEPGGKPDSVPRPGRDRTLVRIDARRRRVVARIAKVSPSPGGLAVANGLLWVMDTSTGALNRLDPVTGRAVGAPFKSKGVEIAVDAKSVWVADPRENSVRRVDPKTGRSLGETGEVPDKEGASSEVGRLVSDGSAAWVGSDVDPILARVAP